ncbi:hypothetical protein [Nostoc sp. TCL240-02]|uniref:hypothetical protein n=1 Tax=Nostoc sp. TCL240-02 TaxID=2572090 RepID=UPI00157FB1EB|nr:hypothetical protein [Nostoc sp. TCL240-02]QKQ74071.1 hypothetical protein FBB35_12700 [Nostoc sp. TCL240-02]
MGKGYWVWVKGFFFPLPPSPFPLNREVLGCDVILAKLDDKRSFDRWLLPMAGGPNSSQAIKLLPALASLSTSPQIKLCQFFQPTN